jgi:outer membrane protein OmpA-like peptidoglycan-associated protein
LAACLLAGASAYGAAGEKIETKGMIVSRTGETLIVNTKKGKVTVVLTDETKTKDNKGLLGLRKEYMANTVLIPGLKMKVSGVTDEQGRIIAKTISVDGDDLETAEMIQAGLHPTAEQVDANMQAIEGNKQNIATNQQNISANKQQVEQNIKDIQENTDRFSTLSDYTVKSEATVKFDVGSSKLSPESLEQLKKVAQAATGLKGYIIEVKGFADSTGSAAMNDKLSEDRADAVVSYLIQQGNVPVRHIVAPGAMGEYQPAASNETAEGRADNRRVEVKVLVNKGISGN